MNFTKLNDKAESVYLKLSEFNSEQKHRPMTNIFTIDISSLELNDILATLDNISENKISDKELRNSYIEHISNTQDDMSEEKMIDIQLKRAYKNGSEFKLLNIYNGLCINTSSKIIKITEDSIYVKLENMQGILMRHEKETVMQSSEYLKDIRAIVKYVDLEKNFAILTDFKFLNTNANERKYSRVTCATRTPIVLSATGITLHGEILDISINSIAIGIKFTQRAENIGYKDVMLGFVLPTKSHEDGMIKLDLKAKVTLSMCDENSCKVICELYEDSDAEASIMEYVYSRQKELILEIKKMVKVSNF